MSTIFMKVLIIQYFIIAVACAYEHNWGRMLYWMGAILLSVGILIGIKT